MPEPIRTLHISTERGFRGGERQVLFLLKGLIERGHPATLIAQPDSQLARRAEEAGVPVVKITMRCEADAIAFLWICSTLRDNEFKIVHMHTAHAHTLGVAASVLAGEGRRVVSRRVVSKVGASWFSRMKYRHGVDRYIAISEAVKVPLLDAGVDAERVSVVNSCIDPARFADTPDASAGLRSEFDIPDGAPVVGTVGALCRPKGFRHFIDAISLVAHEVPDARFVLVGEGDLRAELQAQAARLQLGSDRLIFAGWRDDVPRLLTLFDLFVSSSVQEGLGTSVLQALAMKRPVVVTDAGGLPEIVSDGETGRVVPAGDATALAGAMTAMLNDRVAAKGMADTGHRMVLERFTPEQMVEGTIAAYRQVLAARKRGDE
jgi:glycosyltransferase involved in cell wall biosynthesis